MGQDLLGLHLETSLLPRRLTSATQRSSTSDIRVDGLIIATQRSSTSDTRVDGLIIGVHIKEKGSKYASIW